MKKLSALCLCLGLLFHSNMALGRICDLHDTECQSFGSTLTRFQEKACSEKNNTWIHIDNTCPAIDYGDFICADQTGLFYEPSDTCRSDYVKMTGRTDIECITDLQCDFCCLNASVRCVDNFKNCSATNAIPSTDVSNQSCTDYEATKFTKCECDEKIYVSQCKTTGLAAPEGGESCTDSSGKTWYKECACDSSYTKVSATDVKCDDDCPGNCSISTPYKIPGNPTQFCWMKPTCDNKAQCTNNRVDFDNYWTGMDTKPHEEEVRIVTKYDVIEKEDGTKEIINKEYDYVQMTIQTLTIDCIALGYDWGFLDSGEKCPSKSAEIEGEEPYRCPFDHRFVYCAIDE